MVRRDCLNVMYGGLSLICSCLGCHEARWPQKGRWQCAVQQQWGETPGQKGRLRKYQEEGSGSFRSHSDKQNLQRSHKRQPQEAIRECRDIHLHWPRAGLCQPISRFGDLHRQSPRLIQREEQIGDATSCLCHCRIFILQHEGIQREPMYYYLG